VRESALDEPITGLDRATAMPLLASIRAALPAATLVIALPDRDQDLPTFPVLRGGRRGSTAGGSWGSRRTENHEEVGKR
jgi:hypothetical protein